MEKIKKSIIENARKYNETGDKDLLKSIRTEIEALKAINETDPLCFINIPEGKETTEKIEYKQLSIFDLI